MIKNQMRALFKDNEAAIGYSILIPSPQVVEMIAYAGFDWVLIDIKHGTISIESAELMIMAAEASGITNIAGPRSNSKEDYFKNLGSWCDGSSGSPYQQRR